MSVTLSSLPGKFKCSLLNFFFVLMELLPTPVQLDRIIPMYIYMYIYIITNQLSASKRNSTIFCSTLPTIQQLSLTEKKRNKTYQCPTFQVSNIFPYTPSSFLFPFLPFSRYIYIYIYICPHHYVTLLVRIYLTLSRLPSLSSISSITSSMLYFVYEQNCYI